MNWHHVHGGTPGERHTQKTKVERQVAGEMPTLISLIASGTGISLLPVSAVKVSTATVVGRKILDKVPISEIALASRKKPAPAVVEQSKKIRSGESSDELGDTLTPLSIVLFLVR
jgi:DNA-binding transcriptional LysR family regulator